MPISPAELPGLLEDIASRALKAAVPVADALSSTYEHHLVDVTLTESGTHPPVTQTPSAPGRPPAVMTGTLRGSVKRVPAVGGGGFARAEVAPHTIYAVTQQYGGDHFGRPSMWLWVRYVGPAEVHRRGWVKHAVHIPARPYMDTAVRETIASGTLWPSGERAFAAAVGL